MTDGPLGERGCAKDPTRHPEEATEKMPENGGEETA